MLCSTGKAGRVLTARTSFALLEFRGLGKAVGSLLHKQNSNAAVSIWSVCWICNEGWLQACLRTPYNGLETTFLWFKSSVLHRIGDGCLLQFLPIYGSPSSFSGWGNWVCRRTHASQTCFPALFAQISLLPPVGSWALVWPPWFIFLAKSRNQIPQENVFWNSLCLIGHRLSCSPWQCTKVRVFITFWCLVALGDFHGIGITKPSLKICPFDSHSRPPGQQSVQGHQERNMIPLSPNGTGHLWTMDKCSLWRE